MYALHPGSLPPHSAKAKERIDVTAEDLMALYGVSAEECITWDAADGYEWFDFIHLYPSYYERYTLRTNGTPENDVPCGSYLEKSHQAGGSSSSRVVTSKKDSQRH